MKSLDLALGLRMFDPAVNRQHVVIHEPFFESGESMPETCKLTAVVGQHRTRHAKFVKSLAEG